MMRKFGQKARHVFYHIFKPLMAFYVIVFHNVRFNFHGRKIPKKGPVAFLSNHHTNWDGPYLDVMFYRRNIRFIVHDELFINRVTSFIAGDVLGLIKRNLNRQDVGPIREIIRLKNDGESIGIYPAGDIPMFGGNMPVEKSVAKLVKILQCPVAILNITGASLRAPRWSKYAHRSRITYHLNDVIQPEELQKMDVDTLYNRIMQGIDADEVEYQKKARIKQFGRSRAVWLELGLFMCPECQQIETMKSKGKHFFCTKCGFKTTFNKYSEFSYQGREYFKYTTDWDAWQREQMHKKCQDLGEGDVLLLGDSLNYFHVEATQFFRKPLGKARLELYKDRLEFVTKSDGARHVLFLKDMTRIFYQYKDILEIVTKETGKIRFGKKKGLWSGYMWSLAMNELKDLQTQLLEKKLEKVIMK